MVRSVMCRLVKKAVNYSRKKSPWMLHLDTGGCNGCTIEIFASLTPRYDIERFGAVDKGNPRHADIFLVDGTITKKIAPRLKRIYGQMPEPKVVIAIGSCAITGGVFKGAYNVAGPLDKIIPVDIYVPGCPPRPEAIIDGMIKGLNIWERKLNQVLRHE
jgi:ech hydrogenase subunit C